MHPESHVLMAYRDGELAADHAAVIACHVACCPLCREELDRIEFEALQFKQLDQTAGEMSAAQSANVLAALLAAVRNPPAVARKPLSSLIESQLRKYFGAGASTMVRNTTGDELLSTVRPLFLTFLGNKAGSAVMDSVVRSM